MTSDDWLPANWRCINVEGQQMIDAGEHGILPLSEAYVLRDMLVTTSKRPAWAK